MNNRPDHRKATFKPKDAPGLGDDIPCSKCGAVALDTGLECDECGHDMAPELLATPATPPLTAPAAPEALGEATDEQIIARCEAAGMKWLPPFDNQPEDGDFKGAFDLSDIASLRKLLAAAPQQGPMTEERINKLRQEYLRRPGHPEDVAAFVRAIEQFHGIKQQASDEGGGNASNG